MAAQGVNRPKKAGAVAVRPDDQAELTTPINPELMDVADKLRRRSMADNTQKGYEHDWRQFLAWCAAQTEPLSPLPAHPDVVSAYLADLFITPGENGGHAYELATIERRLAALNKMHELAGFIKPGAFPSVSATIAGLRRERGRGQDKAQPLMLDDIRLILRQMDLHSWPAGISTTRDATVLVMGFAGAFRRSELTALAPADIRRHPQDGLHVTLRFSKTDQTGQGLITALPYGANPLTCPVCAYIRWIRLLVPLRQNARATVMRVLREQTLDTHICRGAVPELDHIDQTMPLFPPLHRSGTIIREKKANPQMVMDAVQRSVRLIGYDPTPFSAHSLRAGFVSQARRAGASLYDISKQTHHRRLETVAGYDRTNPLVGNAVTQLGL